MNRNEIPSRRTQANRTNAQHSTGPRTDAGKSISRLNAVKTALTGRTVLLPDDDMDCYTQHIAEWEAELEPVGPRETSLVQAIADAYWRAERIVRLEFALYAQGRIQFANHFVEHGTAIEDQATAAHPALHAHLIEVRTYLTYERQFRNLSTQEARLRRQRDKDQATLAEIQAQRKAAEAEREKQLDKATNLSEDTGKDGTRSNPTSHGFVLSSTEIATNFEKIFGQNDDEENADGKEADILEPGSCWTRDAA